MWKTQFLQLFATLALKVVGTSQLTCSLLQLQHDESPSARLSSHLTMCRCQAFLWRRHHKWHVTGVHKNPAYLWSGVSPQQESLTGRRLQGFPSASRGHQKQHCPPVGNGQGCTLQSDSSPQIILLENCHIISEDLAHHH